MSELTRNCERARGWLTSWTDGELEMEQAGWLERHWQECEACRYERDCFSAVDGRLLSFGEGLGARDPASMGPMQARFRARICEAERGRRLWLGMIPVAVGLLAAAIVLMVRLPRPVPRVFARDDSGFVAVPFIAPLAPYERSTVLSTQVPVANLLAAGYNMAGDPSSVVQADLLLGEDGRVRAVRLASGGLLRGVGTELR